jgi:hypothetical protein
MKTLYYISSSPEEHNLPFDRIKRICKANNGTYVNAWHKKIKVMGFMFFTIEDARKAESEIKQVADAINN